MQSSLRDLMCVIRFPFQALRCRSVPGYVQSPLRGCVNGLTRIRVSLAPAIRAKVHRCGAVLLGKCEAKTANEKRPSMRTCSAGGATVFSPAWSEAECREQIDKMEKSRRDD